MSALLFLGLPHLPSGGFMSADLYDNAAGASMLPISRSVFAGSRNALAFDERLARIERGELDGMEPGAAMLSLQLELLQHLSRCLLYTSPSPRD